MIAGLPALALLTTLLAARVATMAAQVPTVVIVVADSIPLRPSPAETASATRFAPAALQLQVLSATRDSAWLKVKIGEQRGYQLRHGEQYWVRQRDVATPHPTRAQVSVDLSVHEVPPGQFGRRITDEEFLTARGGIRGPFYVSTRYRNTSDPSCASPFGACARIYYPGRYFLVAADKPETDRSLFEQLYADSTVRVRYELTAQVPVRRIHERLVAARLLMKYAGCYAEEYAGTGLVVIRDTVRTPDSQRVTADALVAPELLFGGESGANVQYVTLMWVLGLTYEDGSTEQIVRRILVWWPMCA